MRPSFIFLQRDREESEDDVMWHVYILEAGNRALYTGITNDLERRLAAHRNGTGARFTKAFGVKRLVYQEGYATRSEALKREAAIKKLPRAQKLDLVQHQ